ncbi:MAG: hypothetical protein MRJ92_02365 [Nitrospira sp.]|nr:hypothetical protein [Nitrospira sp.]
MSILWSAPWCTFTEPEVAHVGTGEKEAQEKGIEVETYTYTLDEVDRAILDGETKALLGSTFKREPTAFLGRPSWRPMPGR